MKKLIVKSPKKQTQCYRMLRLMHKRPVTILDAEKLGIAGSAMARRAKDLRDRFFVNMRIEDKKIYSKWLKRKIRVSQYILIA